MSWEQTFLRPSFRGVPFDITDVTRMGGRDLATHKYPYTNGGENEDLGLKPREIRLQALFWGGDYEQELAQFITALETPGSGELIHPIHGSMHVTAARWGDAHSADSEQAVVDVEFVEDALRADVFSETSTAAKTDAIASRAQEARGAADDALVRRLQQVPSINVPRITVLKDLVGQAKQAIAQPLAAVSGAVRVVLSDLDPLLYPRAYVEDLFAVVDRARQGLPFGGLNLGFNSDTGRSGGTALGDFKQVQKALNPAQITLAPAPAQPDADNLADAATLQAHARAHAACAIAECVAIVLAGELDAPTLDRGDIEAMCNQARAGLQVAIDGARGALDAEGRAQASIALRTLAWQVQETARAVINQKPPLVSKKSPIGGPVRLVAHVIYGDPTRADEISRLNRLGRRVFVEQGEGLSVYSQ